MEEEGEGEVDERGGNAIWLSQPMREGGERETRDRERGREREGGEEMGTTRARQASGRCGCGRGDAHEK